MKAIKMTAARALQVMLASRALTATVYCQVTEDWVAHYNGQSNDADYARDMEIDYQGNVYAVGTSMSADDGADIVTVSFYPDGERRWVARFNGADGADDWGYSIAMDSSGNIYVCGSCQSYDTGKDFVIIKYSDQGEELWVRYYNGPDDRDDEAVQVEVDCAGNVVATGTSQGPPGVSDYVTVKFSPDGDSLWTARYSGPGDNINEARALAVDCNGNVYVSGGSIGDSTDYDYATVKYDEQGTQIWAARYDGPAHGYDIVYYAGSVAVDAEGSVFVTGYSAGEDFTSDYMTIKYDQAGNVVWSDRYAGSEGNDYADAIILDDSGNIYVTGGSYDSASGYDFVTIKYDSLGAVQWIAPYNGPGNGWDEAYGVGVDNSGNVYVVGRSVGQSSQADFATIKYSLSGDELWRIRYDGSGHDFDWPFRLLVDGSPAVYVAGQSIEEGRSSDYTVIRYEQAQSGVDGVDDRMPRFTGLLGNYPNPFNSRTEIRYYLPDSGRVRLTIYNILGRNIARLLESDEQKGYHNLIWNPENESSGVYFYKLETKSGESAKSMILLK